MTYQDLFWSDEFFLKARFIANICQNFNWEPLLGSMVFFLVPFFFLVLFGHMNRDVSFLS